MMIIEPTFTNEAKILYNKFIKELKLELDYSSIDNTERQRILDDVKVQMFDLCNFKEEIIGTDTLKHVINKIGTPKEIVGTLEKENEFTNIVNNDKIIYQRKPIKSEITLTAEKTVEIYTILKYLMHVVYIVSFTFAILALIFYYEIDEYFSIAAYFISLSIFIIIFITIAILIYKLEKNGKLFNNSYIFRNIQPDMFLILPSLLLIIPHIFISVLDTDLIILGIITLIFWGIAWINYFQIFNRNKEKYLFV